MMAATLLLYAALVVAQRVRLGDETLYTHHWRIARYPKTAFAEINAAHQARNH